MFYVRVLTGNYIGFEKSYKEGKRLQAPPVMDASKGISYNSVVEIMDDPRQFIVFDNDQSYPDYLITYSSIFLHTL